MDETKQFATQIRQLVATDELAAALQQLNLLLQNSPKLDEAVMQSARLHDIRRQIRLGLVDDKQANLTKNQIRAGILDLLDEMDTQQAAHPALREEMTQFVTTHISGKNIVAGSITAGGNVVIGDTTTHVSESASSRRLKVFLYFLVPLLAIGGAALWYRLQKMSETLTLTVALDNRTPNPELPFEGGRVMLHYGDKSDTLPIREEVDFKGIPAQYGDETLALRFEAPGFVQVDTAFALSGPRITLPIRRDNSLATLFGTVKDAQENPVAGAQITVQDIRVQSDSAGNFSLSIPFEKQRTEQRIRVYKTGYREWDVTSPVLKNEAIGVILSPK